jgi:hypothetical protein
MASAESHDVQIKLASLRELFQSPELDPLSGRPHAHSGIDRILNMIRPGPHGPVRATIELPASERAPDLEARTRAALRQYCGVRIEQGKNDKASLRHEGVATLWRGLLFLALCMLGSRLVGEPRYLPDILGRFLDEGFIIAGWVALWYPLDVLLYQHWPLTREQRLYERLREMELKFEFVD